MGRWLRLEFLRAEEVLQGPEQAEKVVPLTVGHFT